MKENLPNTPEESAFPVSSRHKEREANVGFRLARLLRCTRSQRYFRGGGWTHDVGQAAVFQDQASAVAACIVNELYEVELVLLAEDREIFRARIR